MLKVSRRIRITVIGFAATGALASLLQGRTCWNYGGNGGCTTCSSQCAPHYFRTTLGNIEIPEEDMELVPYCTWFESGTSYTCSGGPPPGFVATCQTSNGTCCARAEGDLGEENKNILTPMPKYMGPYPQCEQPGS